MKVKASSPCIGICQIDSSGARCVGCGRSLAEIAAWPGLREDERLAIMRRLAGERGANAG